MGVKRNAYMLLVGKPEGKRPLGRPRQRWVDNIKLNIREIGWDGVVWSGSGYGQVQGSCEFCDEPSDSMKYWITIKWLHKWWSLKWCSAP
jgi:hypothetical protein